MEKTTFPSSNDRHGHAQLIGELQNSSRRGNQSQSRRLIIAAIVCSFWLYASLKYFHIWSPSRSCAQPSLSIVDQVLDEVPLIDGHDDLPFAIRMLWGNHIYGQQFTNESQLRGQVDFPRLREGRLGGQFWSIYNSCPTSPDANLSLSSDPFPDVIYHEGIHDILQQIDLVKRLVVAFPHNLIAAASAHDVWSNYKSSHLRISSLMGVEGLHSIGNSPSVMRLYHQLGVRYVTLAHFCNNKYADSASQPAYWKGISEDGKKIITEMNRIGMVVDLAHTSTDTMRQTLDYTDVPLMFSHASAYAVCSHERNVPDDVLLRVKKNGGVVMITFVNEYVNCKDPKKASLQDVADHMEHVGKLIGWEHVGIGSDFDGMLDAPKGLEDVSKYPALLLELVKRGVTKDELKGVVGGNVLRVLQAVEDASKKMAHVLPLEDDLKGIASSMEEVLA